MLPPGIRLFPPSESSDMSRGEWSVDQRFHCSTPRIAMGLVMTCSSNLLLLTQFSSVRGGCPSRFLVSFLKFATVLRAIA